MHSYYTAIMLLCWLTLGTLCVLVYRNNRIPTDSKSLLYLTYVLIAVSALAEWCGVLLNGRADWPVMLLRLAKCADYILTPMAGGALVLQMKLRNHWQKAMIGLLAVNSVFQLVSLFNDWMITVDAQHHYAHGRFYLLYFSVCLAVYALVILQFTIYGKAFKRQNRGALYAIMLVVIAGIVLQVLDSDVRTAYLGMTIGAALMFIHYTEFSQMAMDDYISEQKIALDTDPLTGLLSRYAYSQALKTYDSAASIPSGFAAYSIDINGLKDVNDHLGHEAGDELIRGAAVCIERVFGRYVSSYRTGGDEFVVLELDASRQGAESVLRRLEKACAQWQGEKVKELRLAAGFALARENPDLNAEELVGKADQAMYVMKEAYYSAGHSRRRDH